jgi:hypothetical protein
LDYAFVAMQVHSTVEYLANVWPDIKCV